MRCQAEGKPPGTHCVPYLADALLLIQVDQIDRKPHEEGVDGFAGDDPESVAGVELLVTEESDVALGAGIGYGSGAGEDGIPREVADEDFRRAVSFLQSAFSLTQKQVGRTSRSARVLQDNASGVISAAKWGLA